MKILFTGGGSAGHFYPIIAVAEAVYESAKDKKIILPKLYFSSVGKYNARSLFDNDIEYIHVPAGKMRRYFSLMNFFDIFRTIYGMIVGLIKVYRLYPDVIFGKGGYASFPTLFAAKILRIPVVVHESDSRPGRVNAWAAKFAQKIAVSYPEAAKYFKKGQEKIAFTGQPIRKEILTPLSNGAKEFLNLEDNTPTVVIMGGSQGAQKINDIVIDALPELVKGYQIIHQTGRRNIDSIKQTMDVVLKDSPYSYRYHPFDFLNELALRMTAGMADVFVSRAGSTIFEIANWGVPSIIVPLPPEISHDQEENALSYARTGACTIIEEANFSSHILVSEIDKIVKNRATSDSMRQKAKEFGRIDAARKIADVLLEIGLAHE